MHAELRQVANLALFAKVVQAGGISRCASKLGVERTTISRRLSELEKDLGVTLLTRSSRCATATDEGRLCFERCEQLLDIANSVRTIAMQSDTLVADDPLVIAAPPDLIESVLNSFIDRFVASRADLKIHCHPVSTWSDVDSIPADLLICWDTAGQRQSLGNKPADRIGSVKQRVFASPDYLERSDPIEVPRDVGKHRCIIETPHTNKQVWKFWMNRRAIRVQISDIVEVSCLFDKLAAAKAGLGLAQLPSYFCESDVAAGLVVPILDQCETDERALRLVRLRETDRTPGVTSLRLRLENEFATCDI